MKKKLFQRVVLTNAIILTVIFQLCSPQLFAQDKLKSTEKIDVLSTQWMKKHYITAIVKHYEKKGDKMFFQISVRDIEGNPAEKTSVRFSWNDGACQLITDKEGTVEFEVTPKKIEKLFLEIPMGFSIQASLTTGQISVMGGDSGEGVGILDIASLIQTSSNGIVIYAEEGNENLAWTVVSYLERIRGFVHGFVNMPLVEPFGIALNDYGKRFETVIILMDNVSGIVFPFPISQFNPESDNSEYKGGIIHWISIHEWFETSFVSYGLQKDHRLRYVHDGLAEFVSYNYSLRFYPGAVTSRIESYVKTLQSLLDEGITEYDITEHFHSRTGPGTNKTTAGYPISFWVWLKVHEKGKLQSIQEIIEWIKQGENLDLDHMNEKIYNASGYKVKMIVPVKEVLTDLKKLLQTVN